MNYQDNSYITTQDLLFLGVLNDIKKSKTALQPIYEAFTNAIEAIKIKAKENEGIQGKISIRIDSEETTTENTTFRSLSITDNGIGFNNKEFKRFNTFKDFTKGYKNLGSGRIQYAHYFDNTILKSVFNNDGKFFEREFIVSKDSKFLHENAIVFHKYSRESSANSTGTTIIFNSLLENSNIYDNLNQDTLKEYLIERYIHYFCYNRSTLPTIEIEFYTQSALKGRTTIGSTDIPTADKVDTTEISYSRLSGNGRTIEKLDKVEEFKIDAFKVNTNVLKANRLSLVSKGEIVEDSGVSLQSLSENEHVKGHKYLFLVSSHYIDARDTNVRGELNIPDRDSFASKGPGLFTQEEVLVEDIQDGVNGKINSMYPEIQEVKQLHDEQFKRLKEMFLLDDEAAQDINVSINDSESKILEKFYEAEAKKAATIDSEIKNRIDRLEQLDTTSEDYHKKLEEEITALVRVIPQQNKTALTHYLARRKLVLELFDKILGKKLNVQNVESDGEGKGGKGKKRKDKEVRNKDEQLLHNLIFQQTTANSENSDLWLISEDFIYFDGKSETLLKDIKINGETLFKETLTPEEEQFRTSLQENRFSKRPDILLFPVEGKCIIIEFKNPDVNVSEHLLQINNYATLIRNFSKPQFPFNTFYGFLIGEKINPQDVRAYDADFKEAYHFDYLFRPSKTIAGMFGNPDANLYTEVIKYSTLLQRAKKRNEIFISKLISPNP